MNSIMEILPAEFVVNMKNMLGPDYLKYAEAMRKPAVRGLRVNTKRISVDEFLSKSNLPLEPLGYLENGFILKSEEKLGNTVEHLSGQYYLQEPSSMLAVAASGIAEEKRPLKVLDLCAAPGGKTGQIACSLGEDSLIFSNEIVRNRAEVLRSNVERQGFKNVIILNTEPQKLINFEGYFDYVFVDVPCSGEGMFRKNPETISEWSPANVELCWQRQREILRTAARLVKAGGKLIYSTCTFSESEDEGIVAWLLENFDLKLLDVPKSVEEVTLPGRMVGGESDKTLQRARKFLPYHSAGEGQFVAVFERTAGGEGDCLHAKKHYSSILEVGQADFKLIESFAKQNLKAGLDRRRLFRVGESVFLLPAAFDDKLRTALDELRFLCLGVKLGTIQKGRFEPDHAAFMALFEEFVESVELTQEQVAKFLHGEQLSGAAPEAKGYAVVTSGGFPLGGVKLSGGAMKNLYPKGLRI